ncbi:hypothetical protein BO78DRAFT_420671 [Aspergillus sclerotiicarbonarius CBS 121057]|uniref:Uncharacterized protein n=1 Tax=Aspergillus sclerotiicarbonarius (strain CBS 121057 / IBT 28362) TaxID=1448318 RepID=A0A319E344_ASPSB|nr:hypothetical protein BO78DRAFT_420671 [Aspergillus sclerotiicarbonarius CBS 121057]
MAGQSKDHLCHAPVGDITLSWDATSVCNKAPPYPKPDGACAEIPAIVYGQHEVHDEIVYSRCYDLLESGNPVEWGSHTFDGDPGVGDTKSAVIYYTTDGGKIVKQCTGRQGASSDAEAWREISTVPDPM